MARSAILSCRSHNGLPVFLLTLVLLIAPVYAHLQVKNLVTGGGSRTFVHLLLLGIGVGLGWAALQYAGVAPEPVSGRDTLLIFTSAFAAAHVPAAGISLIKRLRQDQGIDPEG